MTGRRSTSRTGRMPRARRAGIAAVALAALLALTGCMPTFLSPAKPVSTPTGEDVAEDLQPFYSQVLEWERLRRRTSAAPPPRRRSTGSIPATARSNSRSCGTSPRATASGRCW